MVSDDDPVSVWIDDLRNAEHSAAEKLWRHFFQRLESVARRRLNPDTRRVYNEEDAAQSAFHSVCAGLAAGRFPDLRDREGLWRLLLAITARKVARRHRYDHQQRRDLNRNAAESVCLHPSEDSDLTGIERIASREPTPEYTAELVETFEALFDGLDDHDLQQIARLKCEGYTDSEVAQRLDCSRRTIQRRLEIIRRRWTRIDEQSREC